jgi:hypothetical protein
MAAKLRAEEDCSLQSPAHAGSSLADFSTLNMEAIFSCETSVHTRSTRRHIPEDGILHRHRHENLKPYTTESCLFSTVSQVLKTREFIRRKTDINFLQTKYVFNDSTSKNYATCTSIRYPMCHLRSFVLSSLFSLGNNQFIQLR